MFMIHTLQWAQELGREDPFTSRQPMEGQLVLLCHSA